MKFSFVLGIAVFFHFFLRSIYGLTKLVPKLFFVTMARGRIPAVGRESEPICHFVKSPARRPAPAIWELLPVWPEGLPDKKARVPPGKEGHGRLSEVAAFVRRAAARRTELFAASRRARVVLEVLVVDVCF